MRNKLINILTVLCTALVVAGAGVLVSVWAIPQWEAYQAETTVSQMQGAASSSSSTIEGQEQLSDAHEYNSALAGESSGSRRAYPNQLTLVDAQALGWLEIPSIKVKRPVYHYDNEEVLMLGLGHIEGTSLPVGGPSTHCCVTGHSGMLGSRMFDDLDKMQIGDVFVFWTLGDPYAYKVYDIEVVEPDDTSSLRIQPGRDLATLITCTPYGINSHRLLVHGERTEYIPEEIEAAEYHPTSDRLWVLVAGLAAAAAAVASVLYLIFGRRELRLVQVVASTGEVVLSKGVASTGVGADGSGTLVKVALKPFWRATMTLGDAGVSGRWHRSKGGFKVKFPSDNVTGEVILPDGEDMWLRVDGEMRIEKVDGEYVANVQINGEDGVLKFEKKSWRG